MKNLYVLLFFLIYSVPVFAIPGRLEGFSYSGKIKEETILFNERPVAYDEDPVLPHYLNEDLSDARTGASQNGDKYKLMPVYSLQDLYDLQNEYETGVIEEDVPFDE